MIKYNESIKNTIEQLSPHYLCTYLYHLVGSWTTYYDHHQCIEFDKEGHIVHVNEYAVRLIHLAMIIIAQFFDLIGLEQVDEI